MKSAFLQEAKSLTASLLCNKKTEKKKRKGNRHINIKLLIKKRHGIKNPFKKKWTFETNNYNYSRPVKCKAMPLCRKQLKSVEQRHYHGGGPVHGMNLSRSSPLHGCFCFSFSHFLVRKGPFQQQNMFSKVHAFILGVSIKNKIESQIENLN